MAKKNDNKPETWGSRMKEYGGGNFTFLSSDGETIVFVVVGLPVLMKSTYQRKEQERIGCPVVTEDGFVLFICGKRLARKLAKHEKHFATNAIMCVREGVEGDVNAKYHVSVVPETETYKRLRAIADTDFEPSMIPDAVAEAEQVLQN